MWFFPDVSLETASRVADWANVFFIGSLVVGVVSTILIVWMANVKEDHWSELRRQSDERISESRARQAEAELKLGQLQKLAGPRSIDAEVFKKELEGKPKSRIQIWYMPEISDGFWLANQIAFALISAKWEFAEPPRPIPDIPNVPASVPENNFEQFIPRLMRIGAQPNGVSVVAHGVPADIDKDHPSWRALMTALTQAMDTSVSGGFNPSVPEGVLRIVIAAKPDPLLLAK